MSKQTDPLAAMLGTSRPMPAHPDAWLWGLRAGALALCLAWSLAEAARGPLMAWAAGATAASPGPEAALAAGVRSAIGPTGWLVWLPLGACGLLLAEAAAAYLSLAGTWGLVERAGAGMRVYYRVRTLSPANRAAIPDVRAGDLWRALASSLRGQGERVALVISRTANMPATLGVQIQGDEPAPPAPATAAALEEFPEQIERRTRRGPVLPAPAPELARAAVPTGAISETRRIIEGLLRRADDSVLLEPEPDPLASATYPGMTLLTEELVLARGPHWPIAVAEGDPGGLLRTLASSLAVPEGVAAQEYQLILAPAPPPAARACSARARWWAARLRRHDPLRGSAAAEADALATKLRDSTLAVTLRLVVLAQSGLPEDVAAARESLAVMRAALQGLEATYRLPPASTVRQALIPAPFAATAPMPAPQPGERPSLPPELRGLDRAGLATSGLVALAALGLALGYLAGGWRVAGDLPRWVATPLALLALAHLGAAGLAGAWRAHLAQRWLAAYRIGRRQDQLGPILCASPLWSQPPILGVAEASQLWHLPGKQMDREVAWAPNRIYPAPESAFVPRDPDIAGTWLTLGHALDSGGRLRPVGLPLRALHQMMHITAGMGAGKSQAAAAMCAQLIPHGFIVIDGKGDDEGGSLTAVLRWLIPVGEEHRLFVLNVLETAYPVALNPLYDLVVAMEQARTMAERDLAFSTALGQVLALFQRVDPERWESSPGMKQYATAGANLVLRTGSSRAGEVPTMAKIARALEDAAYRRRLLERYPSKADGAYRFWTEREEQLSESQKSSMQALLRRFDLFLENPITRPLLTIERPSINLRQAMDAGQIVLIPIPHQKMGGLAPMVGTLILQAVVAAAYARPGDALSRVTAPVFIDEVQVLINGVDNKDLESAFTQLRGFAVPIIALHQTLDQLGGLERIFLVNAANRLILRTGEPDASAYARQYSQKGLRAEDVKGMEALNHQYAVTLGPKRDQLLFSIRPSAWPVPPATYLPPAPSDDEWKEAAPPPDPRWSAGEARQFGRIAPLIMKILYANLSPEDFERVVGQLTMLPDDLWGMLLDYWERIRSYHRASLLAHPALEPDQLARQAWLTNLAASRGALVEEALAMRQEVAGRAADLQPLLAAASLAGAERNIPPRDWRPRDAGAQLPAPSMPGELPSAEEVVRRRSLSPDEKPEIADGLSEEVAP